MMLENKHKTAGSSTSWKKRKPEKCYWKRGYAYALLWYLTLGEDVSVSLITRHLAGERDQKRDEMNWKSWRIRFLRFWKLRKETSLYIRSAECEDRNKNIILLCLVKKIDFFSWTVLRCSACDYCFSPYFFLAWFFYILRPFFCFLFSFDYIDFLYLAQQRNHCRWSCCRGWRETRSRNKRGVYAKICSGS